MFLRLKDEASMLNEGINLLCVCLYCQ
ncbi:protein of unknown function [Magnetospirillum gryphiswaldense MSR-1 v2]|uniref:Uncharacterized protein n=1 Tax=Magnetospirillum gryphiswaldense (strain DSM 6361 / JCM 21280 / NBRC 15271 / MSR-1) TaxID=431944 RepID=V6EZG3_MAGGM|nr:protein of unknown function [Magnetospirillum gryphiswaldense MSR-1 v2]